MNIERRPRASGKGWEYRVDSLPEAARVALYARAGETMPLPSGQPQPAPRLAPSPVALARGGDVSARPPSFLPAAALPAAPPSPGADGLFSAPAVNASAENAHSSLDSAPSAAIPSSGNNVQNPAVSLTAREAGKSGETGDVTAGRDRQPESLPIPATPDLAELQRYVAAGALRLTTKDLQDPVVQRKLTVARALAGAPWLLKEATRAALARQYGVSPATIRRWCADVAAWRARARVPQISLLDTHLPLPTSRSFQPEAVAAGIACYADNLKRGARGAYEALVTLAQTQGWRIGDYTSYTRLLKQIPSPVWDYLKKGETGFELATAPKILRAWLSTPAYSVLCGDQNIPDYQVVEPSTGEIYTPELYLWMDCTSRAWVGLWPAFGHYSRYTVGAALREACRLALPDEIFTDWGKPETSHYTAQILAGLRGHVGCGDWAAYGSRFGALDGPGEDGPAHRKTSRVGIPWQKPIENQMNILKRALLARDTPGFRQRQAGAWENEQLQDDLKRARRDGQLLTTEQFWERLRDIAADHNNTACRVQESPTPIVPAQVLGRSLASQARTVFDDLTLDLIFLPRVVRAIQHSLVRVQVAPGDLRRFYAPELSRLGPRERVQVSYDPFDADKAAVISHPDGSYLCLAEPWTVQQPGDAAGLADKIRRQMALMKWWRTQIAALRAPLVAAGARAVPRIGAATQVAKLAARAADIKPDAGAAARADQALLARFGKAG